MNNFTKTFTLGNEYGMHARPAALFVKTASSFEADIQVIKEDMVVNGKSIMDLMMLAAESGEQLKVTVAGDDAKPAMDAIEKLFRSNFDE